MAVEISDQKLIDIVYADDDGIQHKYSGPFINDLTITPEIQEQINKLKELDTNINALKDKLDTLKASISSTGSKIKYVTELPEEPEENTCYVLPPNTDFSMYSSLIIDCTASGQEFTTEIGFLDWNKVSSNMYLSVIDNNFINIVNTHQSAFENEELTFDIQGPNDISFSTDILKTINPEIVISSDNYTEAYLVEVTSENRLDYGKDFSSYNKVAFMSSSMHSVITGYSPLKQLFDSNSGRYIFDIMFIHAKSLPDNIITKSNYAIIHCDLGFKPGE